MGIHDPQTITETNNWRSFTFPGQKHNQFFEIQKQQIEGKGIFHRVVTKCTPLIGIARANTEFEVIEDWQTLTMVLFPKVQEHPSLDSLKAIMKTVKSKLVNNLTMLDNDWEEDFEVEKDTPQKAVSKPDIPSEKENPKYSQYGSLRVRHVATPPENTLSKITQHVREFTDPKNIRSEFKRSNSQHSKKEEIIKKAEKTEKDSPTRVHIADDSTASEDLDSKKSPLKSPKLANLLLQTTRKGSLNFKTAKAMLKRENTEERENPDNDNGDTTKKQQDALSNDVLTISANNFKKLGTFMVPPDPLPVPETSFNPIKRLTTEIKSNISTPRNSSLKKKTSKKSQVANKIKPAKNTGKQDNKNSIKIQLSENSQEAEPKSSTENNIIDTTSQNNESLDNNESKMEGSNSSRENDQTFSPDDNSKESTEELSKELPSPTSPQIPVADTQENLSEGTLTKDSQGRSNRTKITPKRPLPESNPRRGAAANNKSTPAARIRITDGPSANPSESPQSDDSDKTHANSPTTPLSEK